MMAVDIRRKTVLCMPRAQQWPYRESSPERTKIWFEPKPKNITVQKVPVIYYLSRNGQLEHPHFMEVPLSSPKGLYLQDVMNRLNFLRGKDMAKLYSWSSKRSYRNGFVWQDLSKNEFIYPYHGHEYMLKGSQLLETSSSFRSYERASSSSSTSNIFSETKSSTSCVDSNVTAIPRKKNQTWSSFENLCEYQVYKAKTAAEFPEKATNAATQTEDDKGRQIRKDSEEMEGSGETIPSAEEVFSAVLSESSLKRSKKIDPGSADLGNPRVEHERLGSGRMTASTVLMQLIGCGSRRIKDL